MQNSNEHYPNGSGQYPNSGHPPPNAVYIPPQPPAGYPPQPPAGYPPQPAAGYPMNPNYPSTSAGYNTGYGVQPAVHPGYGAHNPPVNYGYGAQPGYPQHVANQDLGPTAPQKSNMEQMELGGGGDFEFSDKSVRRAFIRKVYSILSLQLIITFGIMAIIFFPPDVKKWVQDNPGFLYASWGITLALFIVLVCVPNFRRKTPWNLIFLFLFTAFEGYMLGAICTYYDSSDVLKAVVTTIVIVIGLTLFAFQTKIDFTMLTGVLASCVFGLIMLGFMALIFNSSFLYTFYAVLGAVLFSIYIVVDTQLMMGGKHKLSISPEEYIFAALNLYLDIINLFLFLLRIFGGGGD